MSEERKTGDPPLSGSQLSRRNTLGLLTGAVVPAWPQARRRSSRAVGPFLRVDIANFNDWDHFRIGVQKMMNTSSSDPRSWAAQAQLHADCCQHGNYYFLVWHRMYLYFFERILRAASGNDNFALPYWNYLSQSQRQLPSQFVENPGCNPLYIKNPDRDANVNTNSVNRAALRDGDVICDAAFRITNFTAQPHSCDGFGGQYVGGPATDSCPYGALEAHPHQAIHNFVGGDMAVPASAALDPVFWVHHANIDRLWELWLSQGGGRSNPADDQLWMTQPFEFYDETATKRIIYPKDALRVLADLSYSYAPPADTSAPTSAVTPTCQGCDLPLWTNWRNVVYSSPRPLQLRNDPLAMSFHFSQAELDLVARGGGRRRLYLKMDTLVLRNPSVNYELYLNPPRGARLTFRNPWYIGSLGFFGDRTHGHGGMRGMKQAPLTAAYDLTPALSRLTRNTRGMAVPLTVVIAPLRRLAGHSEVEIPARGGIDIGRAQVMLISG
ncbi:MAG: tyrosinase family protein [Bryobacteraceae bacterium]